MHRSGPAATLALVLAGSSCGPAPVEDGFAEADAGPRIDAIVDAARAGDRAALARLVEQLDSDDPAVRLAAINALQRLTDETMGYVHYDDRPSREAAVRRWVDRAEALGGVDGNSLEQDR